MSLKSLHTTFTDDTLY